MVNFNQKIKVDKKLFLFKTIILSCEEVDIRKKKRKKKEGNYLKSNTIKIKLLELITFLFSVIV